MNDVEEVMGKRLKHLDILLNTHELNGELMEDLIDLKLPIIELFTTFDANSIYGIKYTLRALFRKMIKLYGRKNLLEFITYLKQLNDYNYSQSLAALTSPQNKNIRNYINEYLNFEDLLTLFSLIINSNCSITVHDLSVNFPRLRKIRTEIDRNRFKSQIAFMVRMIKNFKGKRRSLLEILHRSNYRMLQRIKDPDEVLKIIKTNKIFNKDLITSLDEATHHGEINNFEINSDITCNFTKDPEIISFIGKKTHCCFRIHSQAESLVKEAIDSPIAGILYGLPDDERDWFAFVWDLCDNGYKLDANTITPFEKILVIDNIEANGVLDEKQITCLFKNLKNNLSEYKRVFLGSSYNDIPKKIFKDLPDLQKRPSKLISKRKSLYMQDSKEVYPLFERKDNFDIKIREMNETDLYRCMYAMKKFEDFKIKEYLKDPPKNSFNLIAESKTHIFAYALFEVDGTDLKVIGFEMFPYKQLQIDFFKACLEIKNCFENLETISSFNEIKSVYLTRLGEILNLNISLDNINCPYNYEKLDF